MENSSAQESRSPWLQVSLDVDNSWVDVVSEELMVMGALSITLQDAENQPVYEPAPNTTPLWKTTRVIGLFESGTDQEILGVLIQSAFEPNILKNCRFEPLADQEWTRLWMTEFQPMRFGKRLWICPSWYTVDDLVGTVVHLDPGLAFGTGNHATTALCLEWLDGIEWAGKTVLDYGCGSGILAIAALKLGAQHAWGVDNDSQALLASRDNAEYNQVAAALTLCLPEQLPDLQVDVVVANILVLPLISLVIPLAQRLKPTGSLALSGILMEQVPDIRTAYQPYFTLANPVERDGWACITGTRNHLNCQ